MGKKRNKPAPGQKGSSSDFATTPRQKRLAFGTGGDQPKRDYEPFVPGPNPQLGEFIRQHATPYDPNADDYDVPAFDRDLVVDKAAPPKDIYNMHMYASKKHWAAIRQYIRHYLPTKHYPEGTGLLIDPFSGSGMTGVAALMEGRPCVLLDASPAAVFISHCYTHPVSPDSLQSAFNSMLIETYTDDLQDALQKVTGESITNLREELNWLYSTKCDRCGGTATTDFVVYSERFQCPKCNEVVPLFDCPEGRVAYLTGSSKRQRTEMKKRRLCPHCLRRNGNEPHRDFVISTRTKKFGSVPAVVTYRCLDGCSPARGHRRHDEPTNTRKANTFVSSDLAKLERLRLSRIPHCYPIRRMMDAPPSQERWGEKWRRGAASFETVEELFDRRNLWALAAIRAAARRCMNKPVADALLFAVTGISLNSSRMYRYRISGKGGFQSGNYYVPQLSQVMNTLNQYRDKLGDLLKGYRALWGGVASPLHPVVSEGTASALNACGFADSTVDFIFTDPPYLNIEVQYGEMNFVWNAWLDQESRDLRNEITLSPLRGQDWVSAEARLRGACFEIARVLKPGRYAAFCYHDTSERNWAMLQDAILDAGLTIETVCSLDPAQKSQKQLTKEKIVKSDLVLNCRKPRVSDDQRGFAAAEDQLVSSRVREIVVETLTFAGGQARDRLWDIVLKRLLARGQMAEHRFDDILAEVAFRSESGRWFLKEELEALSRSDLKNEESAGEALVRFARLRCVGTPVNFAAQIALASPRLAGNEIDEGELESHIKSKLISDKDAAKKFALGGRMKGVEFYDCLFFYLTRFLKGRPASQSPRRNLAEFLEEYLVRFKDGDKWLYRVPDAAEAEALRKSRQSGLGRRIRQYVAFLRGEGEFPAERRPDAKTSVAWLKHCANFGLADEGVLLFEKGGMAAFLNQLSEDDRYDAEDYYAQCRRKAAKAAREDEDDEDENTDDED